MFTGASRRRRPAPHARRSRERRARGPALSGRREVMERAWRQECCAGGRALSRRLEVMGRARRRECRAGGRAFSGRREVMGRAWRQECCARGRVLSRRREVMGRAWRRECRARGCAFSLRGTAGQRPRKPGTRGAAWSSSETLRAEMRCLSQTRPVSTPGQTFSVCQQNPPHRARRGLCRSHAARKCYAYPQHSPSPLPDRPSPSVTANPPRDTPRGKAGVLLHHPPFPVAARDRT